MQKTTKAWLGVDPNHSFALSSDRAERAVRFEAARAYYGGLQQSLSGYGFGKAWLTMSENPCEECMDNEDAGVIPMEELFPSGHDAPLLHLNCECVLQVKHF
jgi:hypothetical protein